MISYNPKDWARFIFIFHKYDTFRKLMPLMLAIGGYAALVAWLETDYFRLADSHHLKNISLLHTLLGFAISMLLVFRTNTAYDRWWEGRRQWGSLVNNSRNLAIKLNSLLGHDDVQNRSFFKQLIPRFAFELMRHLQNEETRFVLDDHPHPEIPNFDRNKHIPNQVASLIMSRLHLLHRQQRISGEELLFLNGEISSFLDICGACERIKNTPIPYSYSAFIKKFIFFYVVTLPLGYVFNLGYLIIPVVIFVLYVLGSLELIAEEIEDPFGRDANDLPMQRISENIRKNVGEILG
ncbi:bestrophin family protein [Paraflavisolibacter sp. H34]|uniref:bestrophin family protein n=1 Tax=Huijunlia imazamoxiresistens TaxID=3127457 RepID=UPI003019FEE7